MLLCSAPSLCGAYGPLARGRHWAERPRRKPHAARGLAAAETVVAAAAANQSSGGGGGGGRGGSLRNHDIPKFRRERERKDVVEQKERAFLVGVEITSEALKDRRKKVSFSISESLDELAQLAETAGLEVVGSTYQRLDVPNPKTYVGSGKTEEIVAAVNALRAETVIFDDELSSAQGRNIEKLFKKKGIRVGDRTALILDIFSQRAATKEGQLQVEMARLEYQMPRLTRMWTHLERQSGGGALKGMGEKQLEVDKRLLRERMSRLKKQVEDVRTHRRHLRSRREATRIPVISLLGYTNAGKSTLLNALTSSEVFAEDKLFATLDPTTRRVELPSGGEALLTDTVGFIQKLPTQLVAAFRATLEEIAESTMLLLVNDVSNPMAAAQSDAVEAVLRELEVEDIPLIHVWNKVDAAAAPEALKAVAELRDDTVCCSSLTGEGLDDLLKRVEDLLSEAMNPVDILLPYDRGDILDMIHRLGVVEEQEYTSEGTKLKARIPVALQQRVTEYIIAGKRGQLPTYLAQKETSV